MAALQDVFDCRNDPVFQAASGLGGGVGLTAETACGGLTGGLWTAEIILEHPEDFGLADKMKLI